MKSVLIDVYKIKNLNSGLGQFSLNFANQIAKLASENFELNALLPSSQKILIDKRFNKISCNFINRHFPNKKKYDLWHSLHQFPSHFPNPKSNQILTIHDLNFLKEKSGVKKQAYLNELQKNVDRANYITSISNFSALEIEQNIDLKGKEVHVIYNGVSVQPALESQKPSFVSEPKFFFSIGIFNRKKNFHTLLDVVQKMKNVQLIIAGNNKTEYGEEIKNMIKERGLESKVIIPGTISETEKHWLYQNCEALLFPSLAEGFGLPVIEAMQFGKPVFISKEGSLPEIGGDLAFYFDDFEKESMIKTIAFGMDKVKENKLNFSQKTMEYGNKFSWESSIKGYLELYEKILKKN